MPVMVVDIIKMLEEIAPVRLAETWDNPGLQVGDRNWPVTKIMVALDPTPAAIKHAAETSVNMLITHHPLVFRPLKSLDLSTPIGRVLRTAIQHSIAVYAAHTNFDSVMEGLNDMLAMRLGLKNVSVLAPAVENISEDVAENQKNGLGRIGDLPEATDLISLGRTLKLALNLENVRLVGNTNHRIVRVALCSGSGGSLLDRFFISGADVFVTGDVGYHDARDAEDRHKALIDIGHFGSEHIMVEQLGNRLRKMLAKRHPNVEVLGYKMEKDPFIVV